MLKSDPSRVDYLSFFGEVALVFGHYIAFIFLGCVEIARLPLNRQSCLRELLKAEIKQPLVVGLQL